MKPAIIHLNIVGFMAGVASSLDKTLQGRPFVIIGTKGGRAIALDASPEAVKAGVFPDMTLSIAEKKITDLVTIPPNPEAYRRCNLAIESISSRYAPVYQSDTKGNWYLDITGTEGLFGPPVDCASRVIKEILEDTGLYPATAAASNKLLGKVATRTIRPTGLIHIREGDEAIFLSHQDINLLPGIGPSLKKTIAVTGFKEIGELASLSSSEALSLFGKQGVILRDMARGIDDSHVLQTGEEGTIEKRLTFERDVIDLEVLRGAIGYLGENAGLDMRRDKLGAGAIGLYVVYADGMEVYWEERFKRLIVLDEEIAKEAQKIFLKVTERRIRIRALAIALKKLKPLTWEPELFIPVEDDKERKVQAAADKVRNKYGVNAVTKGLVLAGSKASSPYPLKTLTYKKAL
jgi:DNA polymerase-4